MFPRNGLSFIFCTHFEYGKQVLDITTFKIHFK